MSSLWREELKTHYTMFNPLILFCGEVKAELTTCDKSDGLKEATKIIREMRDVNTVATVSVNLWTQFCSDYV